MVTHVRIGSVDNRYALTRLAAKAKQNGIRLYRDRSGRYFASSASKPGTFHYLTGYSCDCPGFATHQRCKHHAALMAALGWIDGTPEPSPPAACPDCDGAGTVPGTTRTGPRTWAYANVPCMRCHGSGETVIAA